MNFYCDSSFFFRQLIFGDIRADAIQHAEQLARRYKFVPLTAFTRFEVVQGLRFEAWRNRNDRTKGLPAIQVDAALNLFFAHIGPLTGLFPSNGISSCSAPNSSPVQPPKMDGDLSMSSTSRRRLF